MNRGLWLLLCALTAAVLIPVLFGGSDSDLASGNPLFLPGGGRAGISPSGRTAFTQATGGLSRILKLASELLAAP